MGIEGILFCFLRTGSMDIGYWILQVKFGRRVEVEGSYVGLIVGVITSYLRGDIFVWLDS